MEIINLASFDFDESKIYEKLDSLSQQIEGLNVQREKEKKTLSELSKEYNSNEKELDKLSKTGRGQSEEYDNIAKKQDDLIKSMVRQRQQISYTTTQTRELTNESKQLNQVLDTQDKATRILSNIYKVESQNIDQLREDRKVLINLRNQEVAVMGEQSAKAKQLNKLIEETTNQEKKLVAETEQRFYQIGDYAGQLQGNFQELKDAILQIGSGDVIGGVNSLKGSVTGLGTSLMSLVATPVGAFITALAGIGLVAKYVWDYNSAIKESLILINQLTGELGVNADEIRQYTQSLVDAYGLDFKETITDVKNLVQDFGLTYKDAFDLYTDGLVKGGLANKEFGDSINEYGVLFEQNGYSAQEFVNILNKGFDLGVYTDKLPDAIKEAGLSLEEQTKATRDALVNAFGATFSDDILKRIRTGQISVKTALNEISTQAQKANLNQQQLAQLTADIFRGAGEDAGGAKLIFEALYSAIDDLNTPLNDVQQKSLELQQSYLELEKAKDDAFKSDSVIEFQKELGIVWNQIKTGFIITLSEVVRIGVDGFTQISAGVRTLNDYLLGVENTLSNLSFSNLKQSFNDFVKSVTDFNWDKVYEGYAGSSSARGQMLSQTKKDALDAFNDLNKQITAETNKVIKRGSVSNTQSQTPRKTTTTKKTATATNKVDEAKKQMEKEVEIQRERLYRIAELEAEYAIQELNNQILNNSKKLENEKRLTEQLVNEQKNLIDENYRVKQEADNLELTNKLANIDKELEAELNRINALKIAEKDKVKFKEEAEKEFIAKQNLITQEQQQSDLESYNNYLIAKKDIDLKWEEQKKIDEQMKREIDFANKVIQMELDNESEYNIQRELNYQNWERDKADLAHQYAEKKISAENYFAQLGILQANYSKTQKEIQQIETESTLSAYGDLFSNLGSLFEEHTTAYKAFASATVAIDTAVAIMKTMRDPSIPSYWLRLATSISVGLMGAAQIAKINKVSAKSGASSGSGSVGVSSGTTTNTYKSDYAGGSMQGLTGLSQVSGLTQQTTFADNQNTELIKNAVKEGAKQGASEGSYNGSQQGMKDLSTDRQILNEAKY